MSRKMTGAEDSEEEFDEVIVASETVVSDPTYGDPFAKTVKGHAGQNATVKKRVQRLEKAFKGEGESRSKQIDNQPITGYDTYGVVSPPYNIDYLAKLFEKSGAHQAAVKAKVSNIVGLGYDFVESAKVREKLDKTDSEERRAEIRRNLEKNKVKLEDWLDGTNQEDDFQEVLNKVWTDYETTGNGYLEVGRTARGDIGYIGHIPSQTMRVRRERDGFVQIVSNKVKFFRHFGDKDTSDPIGSDRNPNEVIHLKKYTPTNNYYGVPEIVAAIDAVAGNKFADQFNLDYFEHKAVPRYVVVIRGGKLSDGSQKKIAEFFQGTLKGTNHRTLVVPLPADRDNIKHSFEMKPVEAGQIDSSFIQYRKENRNEIFMVNRVPASKTGLAEGIGLAQARDADKTFKETVCRPEQKIFEKKLNKIIKDKTDIFLIKLNELTLTDEDTLSKMDERYLKYGVILPNEVRARWGWAGIEGGDKKFELKPQDKAEINAQGNRARDSRRSAGATDSAGEGRNEQGAGRTSD